MFLLYFILTFLIKLTFGQDCFQFNYTGPVKYLQIATRGDVFMPVVVTINSTVNTVSINNVTGFASNYGYFDLELIYNYQRPGVLGNTLTRSNCQSASASFFNLGFNDSASSKFESVCDPIGVYIPQNGLFSIFANVSTTGTWNLYADNFGGSMYGNLTGYGLNICPNYYALNLEYVNTTDGKINFIVNSPAPIIVTTTVTLDCGGGLVTSGFYNTKFEVQQLSVPEGFTGTCSLEAAAPYNSPFFSNSTVVAYAPFSLTMVSPVEGASFVAPGTATVKATSPYTGQDPINYNVNCSLANFYETTPDTPANVDYSVSFDGTVFGPCAVNATGQNFTASNTVDFTVLTQLSFAFPAGKPAFVTAGQSVLLNVNNPRNEALQVAVTTVCSSGMIIHEFAVNFDYSYLMGADMNGVGCSMSMTVVGVGSYYALAVPISINVNMGSAAINQFLTGFTPAAFIGLQQPNIENDQKRYESISKVKSRLNQSKVSRTSRVSVLPCKSRISRIKPRHKANFMEMKQSRKSRPLQLSTQRKSRLPKRGSRRFSLVKTGLTSRKSSRKSRATQLNTPRKSRKPTNL